MTKRLPSFNANDDEMNSLIALKNVFKAVTY